ncbi:hypothetical protein ff3pr_02262 [Weissella cibaria]|uniref:Uncharacterized protein n=1 Tax=Weissella cibaria TaxID=137591 RepID=A0A0D1LYQ0_9LACO|nr:hypothetical protein ff3pr_02262 [Weissella cibaria]KIU20971.1 hypothetical protein QX99_00959 [Weissella cibaria]
MHLKKKGLIMVTLDNSKLLIQNYKDIVKNNELRPYEVRVYLFEK